MNIHGQFLKGDKGPLLTYERPASQQHDDSVVLDEQ